MMQLELHTVLYIIDIQHRVFCALSGVALVHNLIW